MINFKIDLVKELLDDLTKLREKVLKMEHKPEVVQCNIEAAIRKLDKLNTVAVSTFKLYQKNSAKLASQSSAIDQFLSQIKDGDILPETELNSAREKMTLDLSAIRQNMTMDLHAEFSHDRKKLLMLNTFVFSLKKFTPLVLFPVSIGISFVVEQVLQNFLPGLAQQFITAIVVGAVSYFTLDRFIARIAEKWFWKQSKKQVGVLYQQMVMYKEQVALTLKFLEEDTKIT